MYHRSFMRPPFEQLVKNRRFRNENYAGVRWPNCIQINTVVDDTEIRIDNLSYENSNLIKFLTYFRNFIIKINNFFSIFALTCSNTVAPADQWCCFKWANAISVFLERHGTELDGDKRSRRTERSKVEKCMRIGSE